MGLPTEEELYNGCPNGNFIEDFDPCPPQPTPQPTPNTTPNATPDATPVSTPNATPNATPIPTSNATPQPTPDATPVATPNATPQPTPEATPQPTTEANPPTNQNIIIKGFVSGSETGSSFPVYDGQGPIGEYNIPQGSGKVHSIYNGSDETIYVRMMAKTYSGGNQSFDAMTKIVYSNTTQDIGDQIYVGIQGGTQNANYQSTISSGNPAYGGSQWVIEIPPIGTRTVAVGIHPSYYSTDGENVSYTFAWSLNELFVRSEQNEITTYVA